MSWDCMHCILLPFIWTGMIRASSCIRTPLINIVQNFMNLTLYCNEVVQGPEAERPGAVLTDSLC